MNADETVHRPNNYLSLHFANNVISPSRADICLSGTLFLSSSTMIVETNFPLSAQDVVSNRIFSTPSCRKITSLYLERMFARQKMQTKMQYAVNLCLHQNRH
jgi:hypothetical protein